MFETFRARRQQKTAEARLAAARAIVAEQNLTVKSNFISEDLKGIAEAQSAFDRSVGPMFDLLNYPTADALDEGSDQLMVRQVNKMYATDPYVHGWIDLLVNFIVGSECQFKSRDKDEKRQKSSNPPRRNSKPAVFRATWADSRRSGENPGGVTKNCFENC